MRTHSYRYAALFFALFILTTGCSEDTEYKQSFQITIPITFDDFTDPAGTVATVNETISPSIGVNVDMRTDNPQLVAAADGGDLDELVINEISYTVTSNSASIDIPALDIAVGPADIKDFNSEDAVLIGSIPPIPAGGTTSGTLTLYPENNSFARAFIFSLYFGLVTHTELSVIAGENIPEGAVNIELNFQLTMLSEG